MTNSATDSATESSPALPLQPGQETGLPAGMSIIRRNKTYYLKRDVPRRFHGVEPRRQVWISLRTDSEREAHRRARTAWGDQIMRWEAALRGDTTDAEARYLAMKDAAKANGFRFLDVERVAQLPTDQLLARLDATITPAGTLNEKVAPGIIGTAKVPEMKLSRALEAYWQVAKKEKTKGKSADQVRRWENPRKKAFANLIAVIGDLPLGEITPDDFLNFRDWWRDKLDTEGLTANSANKDFSYVSSTLREVIRLKRLGIVPPYESLKKFDDGERATRLPFSEKWIREKLLAKGALHGLNREARGILLGMVNTGYRPSEAQDLLPEHIRLDTNVPHISIEPVNRTLKTLPSRRVIPLVGVSLEAFRENPEGFPRYAGKAGLSATVNKFMRENGLMESDDHTLYGLRHSFEDRMLDRDVDERIRRDLMGHSLGRQRYGEGGSLEKLAAAIGSIAL